MPPADLINISAITGHLSAVETAFEQQGEGVLLDALAGLHESVGALGDGPTLQARLELLLGGGHAIDQQQLDSLLTQIRRAVINVSADSPKRFQVQIKKGAAAYKARKDQLQIARRAVDHFGSGGKCNFSPVRPEPVEGRTLFFKGLTLCGSTSSPRTAIFHHSLFW